MNAIIGLSFIAIGVLILMIGIKGQDAMNGVLKAIIPQWQSP